MEARIEVRNAVDGPANIASDIHEQNVLFRLPEGSKFDVEEFVRKCTVSREDGAPVEPGLPSYLVESYKFPYSADEDDDDDDDDEESDNSTYDDSVAEGYDSLELKDLKQIQLIDFSSCKFILVLFARIFHDRVGTNAHSLF